MITMTRRSLIALAAACVVAVPLATQRASAQGAPAAPVVLAAQPAGGFFFRDGDRAMMLGDSITEQRMYSTLVESFVLSRFPNWRVTFRNTGWGGDTMGLRTRGGQENGFSRDIKPLAPTAVTIDFGMNDARSGDGGSANYVAEARSLADRFTALGTRVAFVTASPEERYEANQPAGSAYNVMLRKYSEGLKGVAAEKKMLFVDQLNPMIATIEAGRAAKVLSPTEGEPRLIGDAVHPGWAGQLIMATHILKGLNAPSFVSYAEVDAKTGKARYTKATVGSVKTGDTLSFTRLDESLPWPLPNDAALALQIPGFTPLEDLSRYMLKVTGLTAPNYKLTIDEQDAGTYTREQLDAGLNLSQSAGPIKTQTDQLLGAIMHKNALYFTRWRQVSMEGAPGWVPRDVLEAARTAELSRLDNQIAAAEANINTLRRPVPHVWTLTPVA